MKETQKQKIARLEAEIEHLKTHQPFGILTRSGFDLEKRSLVNVQYVIFGDVDDMHGLNEKYGYEVVNQKIKAALQLRQTDLLLTGLRFSGDEIVFIISSNDPLSFMERAQNSFRAQGLEITLAFDFPNKDEGNNIEPAIDRATQKVKSLKSLGK